MGDTTASIFSKYSDELFQFPLIIVECTFIDNENHGERAADVKHILWVRLLLINRMICRKIFVI